MSYTVENSQNISKFLAGFASKLVGNHNSTVCITSHDGKHWNLINCLFQLLQNIQYKNSLIVTIEEIITNYHAKYYSGCKSVIFLWDCFLQEMIGLKNMNYDVLMISSVMLSCMEEDVAEETKKSSKCFDVSNFEIFKLLFHNLTKGCDIQIKDGLFEICKMQNKCTTKYGGKIRFSLTNITLVNMVCSIVFKLRLYNGILIKPGVSCWSDVVSRRAVLFNGSLTEAHRHVGHKTPKNTTVNCKFTSNEENNFESDVWFDDIFTSIEKNSINTILTTGDIDPCFLGLCQNKYGVTCLSLVPLNVLNLISNEREVNILNSLSDVIIGERCILDGIEIEKEIFRGNNTHYKIHFQDRNDVFQSVVFHHVTEQWSKVKEEEFLHHAKKLELSLREPSQCIMVDGCGKIEKDMADFLNNKADQAENLWANHPQYLQSDAIFLRQILIRRSMANAFSKYRNLVVKNSRLFVDGNIDEVLGSTGGCLTSTEPSSFDNVEIKLASWRTAVYLTNLFLIIDYDILRSEF